MQSRLQLRITTPHARILKKALTGVVDGLSMTEEDGSLTMELEEEGRLIKNAHTLVSYTNYILKTVNELAEME